MKFWHAMAYTEIDRLEAVTIKAEELGFHGVTLSDHLVTIEDSGVSWNTDTHWPDVWVQIGALSKVTSRIHFATSVYVLPMRDPFTVARAVGTAARISSGRVCLGIGTGWQEQEFDLVGQQFKRRGERMDEQLEVMRRLWSGRVIEHSGEFYKFKPLQMSPPPDCEIPIIVGGEASIAIRRAARHDGWWGQVYAFADIPPLVKQVQQARLEQTDTLDGFEVVLTCADLTPSKTRELEDMGVTALMVNSWLDDYVPTPSSLESKVARMEAFAAEYF